MSFNIISKRMNFPFFIVFAFVISMFISQTAWAATYYVSGTGNDANNCTSSGSACLTIQAAIDKTSSGDNINIGSGTFAGGNTIADKGITLVGAGPQQTIIDGNLSTRLFALTSSLSGVSTPAVNFFNMTFQNGTSTDGGGIDVVCNAGSSLNLSVKGSIFSGNIVPMNGGAVRIRECVDSGFSFSRTSFNNNTTKTGSGGAIYMMGGATGTLPTLNIENVTFYQNTGGMGGAAIYLADFVNVSLNYSTIASNVSSGPMASTLKLQGTSNVGTIANTILNNNTGGDCPSMMMPPVNINSLGHNISSDATCTFLDDASDLNSTDALLGTYALDGYTVPTMPLLVNSPAINAGGNDVGALCPESDARSVTRPQATLCDIGAYEVIVGNLVGTPTSLEFSESDTAQAVDFTITGIVPINLGAASIAGADMSLFSLTTDDCSNTELSGSATCKITVFFSASSDGNYSATLLVPNDSAANLEIPLTAIIGGGGGGTAVLGLDIEGPSGDLAVGDNADYVVTLSNTGDADSDDATIEITFPANLELLSITAEGGDEGEDGSGGGDGKNQIQAAASIPEICTFANQVLTCNVGSLGSNSSARLFISTLITGEGSLSISGRLSSGESSVSSSGGSGTAVGTGGLQGACSFTEDAPKSHTMFLFLIFTLVILLGCRGKSKDSGFFE